MLHSHKPPSRFGAAAVFLAAILVLPAAVCAATPLSGAAARASTEAVSHHRSSAPWQSGRSHGATSVATETQGANGAWTHLPPPSLAETGAAYDRTRNRLLLFSGRDALGATNDLWALSLDGADAWSQILTVGARPVARSAHNLIYDPVHDVLWLFGGSDASDATLGDVWTLALGVAPLTWTQASPVGPAPLARVYASTVLDTLNDRVILYGGALTMNSNGPPSDMTSDVWVMPLANPLTWTQISPSGTPPTPRAGAQVVWDGAAQRLVVVGGFDGGAMLNDAYALSLAGSLELALGVGGPAWSTLSPAGPLPGGRAVGATIWDPAGARMVVYGGVGGSGDDNFTDLWVLSLGGSPTWTQLTPPGPWPSHRQTPCGVYDSQNNALVIYGGRDTSGGTVGDLAWSFSLGGSPQWTQLGTSTLGDRQNAGGIFDPVRNRLLIYGGRSNSNQVYGDLWDFDLATNQWSQMAPAGGDPGLRYGQSVIYDPVRDRLVMFGGSDGNDIARNDVWALSLSGSPTWSNLATSGGPPGARTGHVAVYDSRRDRMVIQGGSGPSITGDTWTLDLATTTWSQRAPDFQGPGSRWNFVAVYDVRHDRMVVLGGVQDSMVWTLPLGSPGPWTPLAFTGTPPLARYGMGAAYDPSANTMIVFGGASGDTSGFENASAALLLRDTPTWMPLDFGTELPPGRQNFVTGYDPSTSSLYITGGCCNGLSDVWKASFDYTTPVLVSLGNVSATAGRVEVTWWLRHGAGDVTIERNAGAGWTVAGVRSPDRTGMLAFEDRDVVAGHRYGYRLILSTASGISTAAEVWIDVPAAVSFALDGFQPNPAAGAALVSFRLGSAAPARLQLLDIAGRSLLSRDVGALGPGYHAISVGGASPGVYLLRLTQGGRTLMRKATLLP